MAPIPSMHCSQKSLTLQSPSSHCFLLTEHVVANMDDDLNTISSQIREWSSLDDKTSATGLSGTSIEAS